MTAACGTGLVPESSTIMLVPGKTRNREGAAVGWGHHGWLEGSGVLWGFFVFGSDKTPGNARNGNLGVGTENSAPELREFAGAAAPGSRGFTPSGKLILKWFWVRNSWEVGCCGVSRLQILKLVQGWTEFGKRSGGKERSQEFL